MLDFDHAARRERGRHREALLELADVERPAVRQEPPARGGAEPELTGAWDLRAPQEVADNEPEILAPCAQRREYVTIPGEAKYGEGIQVRATRSSQSSGPAQ